MGDVHQFKKPPRNRGQFTGSKPGVPPLQPGKAKRTGAGTPGNRARRQRINAIVTAVVLLVLYVLTSFEWRF